MLPQHLPLSQLTLADAWLEEVQPGQLPLAQVVLVLIELLVQVLLALVVQVLLALVVQVLELQLMVVVEVAVASLDQLLHGLWIVVVGKLRLLIYLPFEIMLQEKLLSFLSLWMVSYVHPSFFQTLIFYVRQRNHLDDAFWISSHVVTSIGDASNLSSEIVILCSMSTHCLHLSFLPRNHQIVPERRASRPEWRSSSCL